jgi:hypothetical protein
MSITGAVFQPELIELVRSVLDDAAAMLPAAKRTSAMKAEIASQILERAANGERDLAKLKTAAILAAECTHFSHNISPARQASHLVLKDRQAKAANRHLGRDRRS